MATKAPTLRAPLKQARIDFSRLECPNHITVGGVMRCTRCHRVLIEARARRDQLDREGR